MPLRSGHPVQFTNMEPSGWDFSGSAANEATSRPLCEQVERSFLLPPRRLYRYFASSDDDDLRRKNGDHYRGFHLPESLKGELPDYLRTCFFHALKDTPDGSVPPNKVAFDNMIYIRHSTCGDRTGLVETYAHELQHFVQQGRTPRLLAVNQILCKDLRKVEPTAAVTDIPSEREAIIVSKQVAEDVCGAEAVREFAERQVHLMDQLGNAEQKARWVFFRDVPSSNFLRDTLLFVEKYNGKIVFPTYVSQPEWWKKP